MQEIGIECYATDSAGIGGKIRVSANDFDVQEIIDDNILNSIKKVYSQQRLAIFTLEKENIDSVHAARIVSKIFNAKVRILGLKDSRAHTTQYLAVRAARNMQPQLTKGGIKLGLLGYTDENFSPRALLGNIFKIWIRSVANAGQSKRYLELLKESFEARKIPNFYGDQRFGATRPITHLVGRALANASFSDAVRILVAGESPNDSAQVSEARKSFTDGRLEEALQSFPEGYDIERALIQSLIEKPDDYVAALRKISLRIRRLFLAAYSSYVFNKVLSKAIDNKESLGAKEGDISAGLFPDYRISIPSVHNGNKPNMIPMVPTLGYGYYPRNGRFDKILQDVMKVEQVAPKMFYVKEMQETSLRTGLRAAPLLGKDLTYQISDSDAFMKFFLVKGGYATILLREAMKS
ncbi:MAG: tRNA pseudouridine(13) synthase TruD [Thaumarchaeota archaeon]|nr:tRNA pseudouridine(13) synthase TruD [Nitrososphaerota archaeon]